MTPLLSFAASQQTNEMGGKRSTLRSTPRPAVRTKDEIDRGNQIIWFREQERMEPMV